MKPSMSYLCFEQQFGETIVMFEASGLRFFLLQRFMQKQKSLNVVPEIFDLGISGPEFENNIAIFEISSLKLVGFQNSVKNLKSLNLGLKML